MRRSAVIALLAATVLLSGCAPAPRAASSSAAGGAPEARSVLTVPRHPMLSIALRAGRDLGPLPADAVLHLTLVLGGRDPVGLDALLSSGQRVSPALFASRFGPDPDAIAAVQQVLTTAGITSQWTPGQLTMNAEGPARAVDALFGVRVDNWIGPDGLRFYAPAQTAAMPAALRPAVTAVAGLDDYPRAGTAAAAASLTGVTPAQMLDFYNVTPLRNAGLDGSGMTVVLPEIDRFNQTMLNDFARKFNLPPFAVTVAPSSAGAPGKEQGEADLDLEIVHAIAPRAKEVVYYASASTVLQAEQRMYRDYPNGAIESSSLGECEAPGGQNRSDATVLGGMQQPAAAAGWSIFVATGDRGAFDCAPEGDFNDLAADLDASVPYVTAVGGTTVFLSTSGGYFREASWGEPIEQWGGNGGLSEYWPMPSWQQGPGVQNSYSNGRRQTPDVSGNADAISGWDIYALGHLQVIGGTSAAAPFWAACAAIIDQDLKQKGLPLIGFATPALYTFAQNPSGLPKPPYHDVTLGTNLYYPATPGYDLATGLGSADISALASDFEWYEGGHRGA